MKTPNTPLLLGTIALALTVAGCNEGRGHAPPPSYTYDPNGAQIVVGSMHVARADHTMTVIDPANGQVLVAGGMTLGGPTDTAEILDGGSGQSLPVAALMTTPRHGHVAAIDSQTRVVFFGGADHQGTPLSSIEAFDLFDRRFSDSGKTLLEPRVNASVAVDGNRAVIAGGGNGGADSIEIWSLSPLERTGSFVGLAGTPREDVQIVQVGPQLFFLYGGMSGQPNLWIDLAAGTATPAENAIHFGGTAFTAPFAPGVALVVGGYDVGLKFQRGIQIVRPGQEPQGVPEVLPFALFQARVRPIALGTSEGIYVFGGHVGAPVSLVERVSPTDGELYPDLFGAPSRMQAAYLGTDHVVTSGGVGPDGKPLALVNILLPTPPGSDGIFGANAAMRARSQQLDVDLAIAHQQLTIVQNDLVQATAALAQAQADLQSEIARGQALQVAIDQAKLKIADLQKQVAALQSQIPGLQSRVAQLQGQAQSSAAQLQQAQQALSSAQAQLTSTQAQLQTTQGQASSLSQQLATTNASAASLRSRVSSLGASAPASAPSTTGLTGTAPIGRVNSTTSGRVNSTTTGRTGTSPAGTPASGHGAVASLYRPSGSYFGPGSAPNVPYGMAYARDAQGRTWVALVTHQGKQLVFSRDARLSDGVPAHMINNVTVKPR